MVYWGGLAASAVALLSLLIVLCLWLVTLPWQFEKADCAFRGVSKAQYENLLDQAKHQSWTVWPGLSNGVFWPSDRGFRWPSPGFEQSLSQRLRQAVDELVPDHPTADVRLAAAHALMQSLGASLVSVSEVRPFPEAGQPHALVYFRYFLRQRRFAPLCLTCFLWRYTTIAIGFQRDPSREYKFASITVLNGDLKYDPDPFKERNLNTACPSFPHANSPMKEETHD
jgi:hypothetical protein